MLYVYFNAHFYRIRDEDAPPPPPIIFERRNLLQQTIHHWKGNLSKSLILDIKNYFDFATL